MSSINTILTLIAQNKLGIETLETRKSDRLDFHDVAALYPRRLGSCLQGGCRGG